MRFTTSPEVNLDRASLDKRRHFRYNIDVTLDVTLFPVSKVNVDDLCRARACTTATKNIVKAIAYPSDEGWGSSDEYDDTQNRSWRSS